MIGTGAALLGSAIISGIGSAVAGGQQANAADNATALQSQIYQQNRADLSPWRVTGQTALSQLAGELGLPAYGGVNSGGSFMPSPYASQATKGQTPIQDITAALAAGIPVSDASYLAAGFGAGGAGMQGGPSYQDYVSGNYTGGSSATSGATQTPFQSGFRETPGYQFAYNEGMRGVGAGFSARGMNLSGAKLKGLQERGTGLADQEYGTYLNRLAAVSGIGQTTATTLGQLGQSYATSAGQSMQDAGAARASGYAGVSNSFSGGLYDYAKLGAQYGWGAGSGGSGWYGGGMSSEGSIPSVYVTPQVPF